MKICVYGAGAIGGLIAARLAQGTDAEVSVVARGPHLAAIQRDGLRLQSGHETVTLRIAATEDAASLGPQDILIIALKTCSLAAAAPAMAPLISPSTLILPAMNGVPWWFFGAGFGGALAGMHLENLDPGRVIEQALPLRQVLGCVVYPTAFCPAPGVVQHTGRWDLVLGEPGQGDPARPSRLQALCELLSQAGFQCKASADIRREIWAKLVGNVGFNTVTALAGAALDRVLADPDACHAIEGLMRETIAVGLALGLDSGVDPLERMARARPLGATRPSMLQDIEAGRPTEHEALTGAVLSIAQGLDVPVPLVQAMHGMIRLRSMATVAPGRN